MGASAVTAVRRGFLVVLLLLVASGATMFAHADPPPSLQQQVERWASDIGAPSISVQIVDSDGLVDDASSGPDAGAPFVWGSVSKQLAAATVRGLERDGLLQDDTVVVDVLPQAEHLLGDPQVTVGDLVRHTSGLPHDVSVTDDWTRRESASDVLASIPQPSGMGERGTFRYSSLNYLLVQAVVEQVSAGQYADAVRRYVLDPAGASGTITDPDAFTAAVPDGHVPFFGTSRAVDVGVDSAGLGYGYLAGTIEDLGRYASWRLDNLGDPVVAETGHGTAYGDGLYNEDIDGHDVWWHSGAVPGYYTYVALVPGEDRAIVLATNRYGEIEAERVAAVGRNVTTLVLDGSASDLPSSMAPAVLGTLLGLATALLAASGWSVVRGTRERSAVGAIVRSVAAVVVGGTVIVGVLIGVPALAGGTLSAMWLWTPDVTVAFWVLLAAVFVATVVVVIKSAAGYRKLRSRTAEG
ncbi:hypothetical protein CH253_05340 [Rhodococcus sp. 06-156-3C]|nr:hypothetical protein CH280_20495 [Rhodococcus sp. 06-156-4C]OZD14532.1 hypothetical protein CH248_24570 [Rhodococcus sp. 06-156-4a]OZD24866.1 hypothetical protein CH253_05340 [Rhodococcus sp. 06-156-3C]OZD27840.1 hypothetical protein CH247_21480 [Rhodococcus sp. 06-156-3b]OZD39822.1 hypothetical protein CH284_05060 [Rhodococcus sp. 06-156-3]OZF60968.1 hypothetical protein CH290_16940 [Rhodococcus sp. 06-156-4]